MFLGGKIYSTTIIITLKCLILYTIQNVWPKRSSENTFICMVILEGAPSLKTNFSDTPVSFHHLSYNEQDSFCDDTCVFWNVKYFTIRYYECLVLKLAYNTNKLCYFNFSLHMQSKDRNQYRYWINWIGKSYSSMRNAHVMGIKTLWYSHYFIFVTFQDRATVRSMNCVGFSPILHMRSRLIAQIRTDWCQWYEDEFFGHTCVLLHLSYNVQDSFCDDSCVFLNVKYFTTIYDIMNVLFLNLLTIQINYVILNFHYTCNLRTGTNTDIEWIELESHTRRWGTPMSWECCGAVNELCWFFPNPSHAQ